MKNEFSNSDTPISTKDVISYSLIGVLLIIVMVYILTGNIHQDEGIEVERMMQYAWKDSPTYTVDITTSGDYLVGGKNKEKFLIKEEIIVRLSELKGTEKLIVLIRPEEHAKMEDFGAIFDTVKEIKDDRIFLQFR